MTKINGFTPMSVKQQEKQYGGWAWLVAWAPLILQGLMAGISAMKMIESNKGSVKYKGIDAHWDNGSTKSSSTKSPSHIIYSF